MERSKKNPRNNVHNKKSHKSFQVHNSSWVGSQLKQDERRSEQQTPIWNVLLQPGYLHITKRTSWNWRWRQFHHLLLQLVHMLLLLLQLIPCQDAISLNLFLQHPWIRIPRRGVCGLHAKQKEKGGADINVGDCPERPGLCAAPCFWLFHTQPDLSSP